jgi:2-dehydropantoate 2-reductase
MDDVVTPLRIAVVGAGAMGSIFGAALAEGGSSVTLLDVARPLVEQINAQGLTIVEQGGERTVRVSATDDPGAIGAVNAAIVFVKCYHTRSAAELLRPLLQDGSVVASLQNGWGNEEILADVCGRERVAAGVTYQSATVLASARVNHNAAGTTFVGPYDGLPLERLRPLERALRAAGIEVVLDENVLAEVWKKLVFNAAGLAVGALTGLDVPSMAASPLPRELAFAAAREASAVARAAGYEIDADERVAKLADALGRGAPGAKGSMRQDFEAGRRTEIDVINGAVVREAEAHGLDVPLNRALLALVKGYEAANGLA